MIINYFSDLHIERFEGTTLSLKKNLPFPKEGDICIIAGDLGNFQDSHYGDKCTEYLNELGKNFESIFIVPGNHEYYFNDYENIPTGITKVEGTENSILVKDKSIKLHGVNILFTTLFSKLDEVMYGAWKLNDFNYINYDGKRLTKENFNKIHEEQIQLVKDFINDGDTENEKIIVSHFPPVCDIRKMNKRQFDMNLDCYFYNEVRLEGVDFSNVKYWIYGHNHFNPEKDVQIGNTKFVCNQVGYYKELLDNRVIPNKFIEIGK